MPTNNRYSKLFFFARHLLPFVKQMKKKRKNIKQKLRVILILHEEMRLSCGNEANKNNQNPLHSDRILSQLTGYMLFSVIVSPLVVFPLVLSLIVGLNDFRMAIKHDFSQFCTFVCSKCHTNSFLITRLSKFQREKMRLSFNTLSFRRLRLIVKVTLYRAVRTTCTISRTNRLSHSW